MALISSVGRRSLGIRLILVAIYLVLFLGAVSMIYPFALMISTATTSQADAEDFRLVPAYWFDQMALFKKYLVDAALTHELSTWFGREWFSVRDIRVEELRCWSRDVPPNHELVARDWQEFISNVCPDEFKLPMFVDAYDSPLALRAEYVAWLRARYDSIDQVNTLYVDSAERWEDLVLPAVQLGRPPANDPRNTDWRQFVVSRPPQRLGVVNFDTTAFQFVVATYGTSKRLIQETGLSASDLTTVTYDQIAQGRLGPKAKREFFTRFAPLRFVKIDVLAAEPHWRRFLSHQSAPLNLPLTQRMPSESSAASNWALFVQMACPVEAMEAARPDIHWREFLQERYGSVSKLNHAYGTDYPAFGDFSISRVLAIVHYDIFSREAAKLRRTYLWHNFATVLDFVAVHGGALRVTVIYMVLLIATTLTVNPLAAYALSRFRLKETHQILIFMLATMAFPAEVLMIPSFLLIKSFPLGQILALAPGVALFIVLRKWFAKRVPLSACVIISLLVIIALMGWVLPWSASRLRIATSVSLMNSFWALVLPGLANGFSIFLLKGFFDSLPPELYEAGLLDGAGELRMFWQITLPMCKPILAVMALGAFTTAYGAFMHAFLVCQDPKMWTLMVFLYEFQQSHSVSMVMASLVLAAIPTLIAFVVCQRVILRGIVVPSFK